METASERTTKAASASRPVLPLDEIALSPEEVRALRHFHLGGAARAGQQLPGAFLSSGDLPALLSPFRNTLPLRTDFPLFLGPPAVGAEGEESALCLPPAELLGRAARQAGLQAGPLADNLLRLERCLVTAATGDGGPVAARPLLAAAGQAMVRELNADGALLERLEGELAKLVAAVPQGGTLLPRGEATSLHLLHKALLDRHRPAWAQFRTEVLGLAERLEAMLAEDRLQHGNENGEGAVASSLGALGSRFLDSGALRSRLARQRSGGLDEARRQRLTAALATLTAFGEPPLPLLVHEGGGPGDGLDGWRSTVAEDPCAVAAQRFDAAARDLAGLLRAVRLARLEIAGDYEDDVHGLWLERFDWRAFADSELPLLPPVVVQVSASNVAAAGMVSLSRLLLSGRPVQVLAEVSPARHPELKPDSSADPNVELSSFRFELAYLGISHREAFVQQTFELRPVHAMAGFRRAANSHRGALHVVAGSSSCGQRDGGPDPWLLAGAALDGRAHPLFLYDPEAGPTWARRMDFQGNPAPEEDWPIYDLEVSAEASVGKGGETAGKKGLSLAFTFADFSLLDAAQAGCFRLLPAGTYGEALVPLAQWLSLEEAEILCRIPFVWVADAKGSLRRAVVTRPLAFACRDRLDFWRTLQELAGARSEYAERAAQAARREERERLEARHRQELERLEGEVAGRLADRLTAALLSLGGGEAVVESPLSAQVEETADLRGAVQPVLAAPSAISPSPDPENVASKAPPPSQSGVEAEAMDPYIDTALCTTCNECIQINPKLFAYDENKQAYIADPRAGTFQELVKAAELCSARIIHPGTPLNRDEPDLEEWSRRAQPFS